MQISKRVKVIWSVLAFIVIAISLIVAIDKLDFVSRWLEHLEPFKNNIERFMYFCALAPVLILLAKRYVGSIKGVKVNAGNLGFEVELNSCSDDEEQKPKDKEVAATINTKTIVIREADACRKILEILQNEMDLNFTFDAVLKHGDYKYRADGLAIKNERVYIVEVKVGDNPRLIDVAVTQVKFFCEIASSQGQADICPILCFVSDRPVSYFRGRIASKSKENKVDVFLRVFNPNQLSNG